MLEIFSEHSVQKSFVFIVLDEYERERETETETEIYF